MLDEKEDSVFEDDARFLRYPPKVVLVEFYEWVDRDDKLVQEPCAWHIDGMDKCGVYIRSDRGREHGFWIRDASIRSYK